MIVVGWNNGNFHSSGAGYGIRISKNDRDIYFSRDWEHIVLDIGDDFKGIKINLSNSFWKNCTELRSKHLGSYMIRGGLAPWLRGNPPKFILQSIEDNKFRLIKV